MPRYSAWDFYLISAKQTNGPELRFNLQKSAEEQRQEEYAEMANAIRGAFSEATSTMRSGEPGVQVDPQAALNTLTDEQLMGILEARRAEQDALEDAQKASEVEGEGDPAIEVGSVVDEIAAPKRGRRKNA